MAPNTDPFVLTERIRPNAHQFGWSHCSNDACAPLKTQTNKEGGGRGVGHENTWSVALYKIANLCLNLHFPSVFPFRQNKLFCRRVNIYKKPLILELLLITEDALNVQPWDVFTQSSHI